MNSFLVFQFCLAAALAYAIQLFKLITVVGRIGKIELNVDQNIANKIESTNVIANLILPTRLDTAITNLLLV